MIDAFTLRMAWRDSRGSRRRLLLFLFAMVVGVAVLVAIQGFGASMERAVRDQSFELLGADVSVEQEQPLDDSLRAALAALGGEVTERASFASMAFFPRTGGTRLVWVEALEGGYPYYGSLETAPAEAARTYQQEGAALVEATLLAQFGLSVGDSVRVGRTSYRIAGRLDKAPRQTALSGLVAPRVFLPLARLDTTLLGFGSRADYGAYVKLPPGRDDEATAEALGARFDHRSLRVDSATEAAADWGEGLTNLYRFLGLMGLVALLLGATGVASAIHVHIRRRLETVAVLRCLGASSRRTVGVYLAQAAAMGLLGGILGGLLGLAVQLALPTVLADFLPVEVPVGLSWRALGMGLLIGTGVTVLFALLPLATVQGVSPMRALRANVEDPRAGRRLRALLLGVVGLGIVGLAVLQAPSPTFGVAYAAALLVVFGLLALVARLFMAALRRFFPSAWAYPWRQGLANLYRPGNQTLLLLFSIGLGTFLLLTMLLVQRTLLGQIDLASGSDDPNLILFEVQPDQLEGVTRAVREAGLPVMARVPIVNMRLRSVKGQPVEALAADSTRQNRWVFRREYRSSYRDALTASETLVAGTFTPRVPPGTAVVPVSLEQDIARDLGVGVGDTLVFDVQGLPVTTTVGSLRAVEWRRLSTNFFVVFPAGVLEQAPQLFVVLTRAETEAASAALQRGVVSQYPNVSAIDLSLIQEVIGTLFDRIGFVIRFMVLFSVLTGLLVLAASVVVSRYQRVAESVLLKTLGASRRQVLRIMLIEYLFLGLLAAATGLVLAVGAGWSLARFVFDTPFAWSPGVLLGAAVGVVALTVGIGVAGSRGLYRQPALAVLRAEA